MKDGLLEISDYREPGYRALVYHEGWRVALLNDDPARFRPETLGYLERHNLTDEVFVLLSGECTLLIGDGDTAGSHGDITRVTMEKGKLYNVKRGVWHNLLGSPGMTLLIVENADTSRQNSDYSGVSVDEIPLV